jgi:hypothetical protein
MKRRQLAELALLRQTKTVQGHLAVLHYRARRVLAWLDAVPTAEVETLGTRDAGLLDALEGLLADDLGRQLAELAGRLENGHTSDQGDQGPGQPEGS